MNKTVSEHRTLKRIGGKLRDETRDIVEERLPERLRDLLERLTGTDQRNAENGQPGH